MRISYLSMCLALGVVLIAFDYAAAQCDFNGPDRSHKFRTELTRAYAECDAPDATAQGGADACVGPRAESSYRFNAKGRCRVRMRAGIETDGTCVGGCNDVALGVLCDGIHSDDNTPLGAGENWNLGSTWRATVTEPASGSMTLVDFSLSFAVASQGRGRIRAKHLSSAEMISGIFGPTATLPVCTSIELIDLVLLDPLSARFASSGAALGSDSCSINMAGKSIGMTTGFARAFHACPSEQLPTPNTTTSAGMLACADGSGAPVAQSTFRFQADGGKCLFKAKPAVDGGPCRSDPTSTDCLLVNFKFKCQGVTDASGEKIHPAENQWRVRVTVRSTIDDRGGSSMTLADRTVEFGNKRGKPGLLAGQGELTELLVSDLGAGAGIPRCASVEIVDVEIIDSLGEPFARTGLFSLR